jgi:hypothetical protein
MRFRERHGASGPHTSPRERIGAARPDTPYSAPLDKDQRRGEGGRDHHSRYLPHCLGLHAYNVCFKVPDVIIYPTLQSGISH